MGVSLKKHWQAGELEVLLNAIDTRRAVRVYLPGLAQAVHTSLSGFDINSSELLLDTFQPFSRYELEALTRQQSTLTLAISHGAETWFIGCKFQGIHRSGSWYLASVLINTMRRSLSKRLHPRIYFSARHRPLAKLRPLRSPLLRGELLDLSVFGCQIQIPGRDIRAHLSQRTVPLTLYFNDEFQLDCDAELKQLQFLRTPCCHNKLRLMFNKLDALQVEQLQRFAGGLSLDCAA